MTMSGDDVSTSVVQRFEVFTGAGKRREWPAEVKASIVAESFSGQEAVSSVARRHGIAPNQLFAWRRDLRKECEARGVALAPVPQATSFVPAVVDALPPSDVAPASRRRRERRRLNAGAVELEIDGVSVTIGRGADAEVIAAVNHSLIRIRHFTSSTEKHYKRALLITLQRCNFAVRELLLQPVIRELARAMASRARFAIEAVFALSCHLLGAESVASLWTLDEE